MTPAFVLDPSAALAWCFLDEATVSIKKLFGEAERSSILVPAWWFLEVTNALVIAERRGRIDSGRTEEFLLVLKSLDIQTDLDGPARAFDVLLPLCRTHGLTSYDAVYLDLALRRDLPLATLDEPLRKAARKLGVRLLGR